ncbi:MAG TPA: tRNA pseudouridine(38-40) synthase TruA [Candidatus Acidoferrum sp.]|nr:tRNA pseudouridine(38-40) synthase TruA [Candidatus Acidoferrum sp.]HXJ47880.1 tRNA pseudouridine(38-40) synthase TruA [Candidatus Acidoferrum sp.]
MNIKVVLEYDGSGFAGWQQQAHGRTVEAELKRALRAITGQDRKVYAAGRTDAGAHAEGQVVSFQTDGRISPRRLVAALNAKLPADVAILSAEEVPDTFHARYSARWRRYRYRYLDRPSRPALERGRCWQVRGPLDVDAMSRAAEALLGKHDWTSYCSASEPADARVREMRSARVTRNGDVVELELVAEGFLRGLARSIAGALAEVGRGRRPPEWVGEVLGARDRRKAAKTAPAGGLTLMEVIY